MSGTNNTQYLEGKVLTASQPRLHLMLLEGASRQCTVAQQAGSASFWGEFDAALGKAMDIVEELVNSVTAKPSDVSKALEEQYAFLFRELAAARVSMDLEKLGRCAKLLDFERETWKLVCEKVDAQPAARPTVVAPRLRHDTTPATEGLSLEA